MYETGQHELTQVLRKTKGDRGLNYDGIIPYAYAVHPVS